MANAWIWLSPSPFHSSVVFLLKWEKEVKKVKQKKKIINLLLVEIWIEL